MPELVLLGGPATEDESRLDPVPNIVLLHGFGADSQSWVGTAPALFSLGKVWALDLPGHGKAWSEAPAATLKLLATQIESAVFDVSDQPIHIIGHSVGGALAMLLAQQRSDSVSSLVLLAPLGLGKGVSARFIHRYPQLHNEEETLNLLRSLVFNQRLIPDTFATLVLSQLNREGVRVSLTRLGSLVLSTDDRVVPVARDGATHFPPTLVIWGEQDQINPLNSSDKENFGGEWQVLENCGHLPHVEHRVVVNNFIEKFLIKIE